MPVALLAHIRTYGFALVLSIAVFAAAPGSSLAATASERPFLGTDRSNTGASTGHWDEIQGALHQTASHSLPQFASAQAALTGIELDNNFPVSGDACGGALASGDVNGDGRADVVMACVLNDDGASNAGSVIVFTRNAANTDFDAGVELDNNFPLASDFCGQSVAVGDVNADGRDDVVMGCDSNDDGATGAGSVIVFTRNAANTGFDAGVELDNNFPLASDFCGASTAVGDVNADGRDDVVMGCYSNDDGASGAGSAIVFTRNAANNGFDAGVELDNNFPLASDGCGRSVAVGDVNADGRADVLMGCSGNDDGGSGAGSVIVLTRNASNTGFDAGVELDNVTAGDACGWSLAAGDVNGDGRDDVVAGCYMADAGTNTSTGGAIVFVRDAANTGFDAGVTIANAFPLASDECGQDITSADIDGDGFEDVVMGCVGNDDGAANAGSAIVVRRNSLNTGFDSGVEIDDMFATSSDACGESVSAGDVNGDGRADVMMGCDGRDDGASAAGSVQVFASALEIGDELDNDFPALNDLCGRSVASGDVNADGYADAVMGCYQNSDGAASAGSAIVRIRNAANTGFDGGVELDNPFAAASDECGFGVALGDVNADGRSDVVLGCKGNDDGASNAGSAVLFTRNVANTGFDAGIELDNPFPAADDRCGYAVAVGDVNGDYRADVVMGCNGNDDVAANAGSMVVFTRNAANTGFDAGVELDNNIATGPDMCGVAVVVGDVNDDDRADLLMGCPVNGDGAGQAGSMMVFTRNAGNTGFDAGVELDNPFPALDDFCGWGVATADVNADGRSDAILGCERNDDGATNAGSVIVFTRNAANTAFDAGVELDNPVPGDDSCGMAVAGGDVNGDGRDDVVMGCWQNRSTDAGSTIVFTRNAANNGFDVGHELDNPSAATGDQCGVSVASGDVDGDGRSDVMTGCFANDDGASGAGSMVVAASASTGTFNDTGVEFVNDFPLDSDACGKSVAAADVNGDGRADLVMSCYSNDDVVVNSGSIIVRTRNAANTGFDAAVEIDNTGAMVSDLCGEAMAAGDVNADGRADLALGCFFNDVGASTNTGGVLVMTRNAANNGFDMLMIENNFAAANDGCGSDVAMGDVNADGRDDVIMGCSDNSDGAGAAGSVIVLTRNAANTGFNAGVEIDNNFPTANDFCGSSVATGDVNADGRDDIAMGCLGNDDGALQAGSAIILVRNAANTGFNTGVEIDSTNPVANENCGRSVELADVNGDSRDDLVMPCNGNLDISTRNAANTGFDAGVDQSIAGMSTSDGCGNSPESMVVLDVTADGKADVVLGCSSADAGAANAGTTIILPRNVTNTGWEAPMAFDNPEPETSDSCGAGVAIGNVDGSGRLDLVMGCGGNDIGASAAGSMVFFSGSGQRVTSRRLNRNAGTVSAATISWAVLPGAQSVSASASADGGSTWDAIVNGAAHSFGTPGTDLRVRFDVFGANASSALVHDVSIDYTYVSTNAPPTTPSGGGPAGGGSTSDTTPDLSMTFDDPDVGDTGTVHFEVCTVATTAGQSCVAAGGIVVASGSSPAGIADGADGTWTVTPALGADATYYWHGRTEDQGGAMSGWSATRSIIINSSVSLSLDVLSHPLGALAPGTTSFATSVATVSTNDPDGYTLTAIDEHDSWGADCVCADQLPDWTGTNGTPTAWGAAVFGYLGVTVRDTTGTSDNRLAKWGTASASGWPESNTTNNFYAGLDNSASTTLHATTTATSGSDTATLTWRVAPSSGEVPGAYDATVTVMVVANP